MAMSTRAVTLAVVTSILLQLAAAHKCADGSRVRCMPVTAQSSQNAPRASGGKSASGSPFCTLSGKKVYCLKQHSYHQCADGEEPCCQDGTNPAHYGNHDGGSSDMQCSTEAAPSAAQTPIQIVFDDMERKSTSLMANAHEGTFEPCMRDAWKGQFHHDWARNKGSASYTFKVNVPKSGCYKLEEYHPGNSESCAQYLPKNAQLDVKYCKGKSTTIWVNQATNAAQWNELGSFMYYEGTEGELTMRNHKQEECRAANCFWVVDAFRLTRTGETCEPGPEPEPSARNRVDNSYITTENGKCLANGQDPTYDFYAGGGLNCQSMCSASSTCYGFSVSFYNDCLLWTQCGLSGGGAAWAGAHCHIKVGSHCQAADSTTMPAAGQEGTLMLQASLTGGSVQFKLEEHQGVLETVLASHLGRKHVQVLGIWKDGRRLHGGHADGEHIKIKFLASNAVIGHGSSSSTDLRQALQDAFDKVLVGPGITFQSASASWGWESKDTTTEDDEMRIVTYIIAGAATLVALLLALFLCIRCRRARKRDATNDSSEKTIAAEDAACDLENISPEKKEICDEKLGDSKDIDVEVASVSTGTPGGSDEDSAEGSKDLTPSNSYQLEPDVVVSGKVVPQTTLEI